MKHVTDSDIIAAIKVKLGYQEKITYCKDCDCSTPNPDITDRALTLLCTRIDLVPFATGKMKTCSTGKIQAVEGAELAASETGETTEENPEPPSDS